MKYLDIKAKATQLRRNPTEAELMLWEHLKHHKLSGKKFLRQHPVVYASRTNEHFYFIPDFYCAEAKLAIELDGKIHERTVQHDTNRDAILNQMGINVLRIKNEELKELNAVIEKIRQALT